MKKTDVVLLTQEKFLKPQNPDWYSEQIIKEDQILIDALQKIGMSAERVAWDNPTYDWSKPGVIFCRAIWDYFLRIPKFNEWLEKVEKHENLLNSAALIRWNMDKHYIGDLQGAGIETTPTIFIEQGDKIKLSSLFKIVSYDDAVLKPTISGAARHTYRLNPENCSEHENLFQELIEGEAMMFQPFQKNILTEGEKSHIIIGGQHTHSVIKNVKSGDFRVQDNFGGSVKSYKATEEEIRFAENVISKMNPQPAYARVDTVKDNNGKLSVVELELIEPELWFRLHPEAAVKMAEVIASVLKVSDKVG